MSVTEQKLLDLSSEVRPTNSKLADALELLSRTTEEVVSFEEFRTRILSGKKLRMKFGVDLTAPFLHLGHAVNLWTYRTLQDLGHKLIFLLGDATTRIGDPTGRNESRPVLTSEQIEESAKAFTEQVSAVVRLDPEVCEIRRNSEWFDPMSSLDFLSLISKVTLDKLLARDMFRKRQQEGHPIYAHELLYPILQGYDSRMSDADITVIGSDQLYNEMMGRFYQESFGQRPQVVMTTVLTPGIDGGQKMSKSIGNYVALAHTPKDKFGRVMSIPDNLIAPYLKVYTDLPLDEVSQLCKAAESEPMKVKPRLAEAIVARYHGIESGKTEHAAFIETFSRGKAPKDIPTIVVDKQSCTVFELVRACFPVELKSNSDIRRLIQQGAVSSEKTGKLTDLQGTFEVSAEGCVVQIGKRDWFLVRRS